MKPYTPPPETPWTAATLTARIAEIRREHDARTEAEALEITRRAIRQWNTPRFRVVHPPHTKHPARRVRRFG